MKNIVKTAICVALSNIDKNYQNKIKQGKNPDKTYFP